MACLLTQIQIFGEFPQKAAPVIEKPGSNRFLADEPRALLARGNFKRIPLMIGTNRDEASYFYPRESRNNARLRFTHINTRLTGVSSSFSHYGSALQSRPVLPREGTDTQVLGSRDLLQRRDSRASDAGHPIHLLQRGRLVQSNLRRYKVY